MKIAAELLGLQQRPRSLCRKVMNCWCSLDWLTWEEARVETQSWRDKRRSLAAHTEAAYHSVKQESPLEMTMGCEMFCCVIDFHGI